MASELSDNLRKGVYIRVKASIREKQSPASEKYVLVSVVERSVLAKILMKRMAIASKTITITENIIYNCCIC